MPNGLNKLSKSLNEISAGLVSQKTILAIIMLEGGELNPKRGVALV